MFGFIRPVKAELRVKEADRFQQVYCGLCHAIRAEYGRFYTLFLSYDMTFFALVAGSEEAETAPPCRKRCDASPFRRKSCAETDDARFKYPAQPVLKKAASRIGRSATRLVYPAQPMQGN